MPQRILEDAGENEIVRWIRGRHPDRARGVLLGIGDDAAALRFTPGLAVVASVDSVIEGVHFRRDYFTPELIGRKAVAVNLSDMAAMGARARFLLCQAGLPRRTTLDFFRRCLGGLMRYARSQGLSLVGGDVASTPGPLFLSVTILGEAPPGKLLTRSGARAGDFLVVSGRPGESRAGLLLLQQGLAASHPVFRRLSRRHLRPEPRLEISRLAVASGAVTAAIDISDGLSTDLDRLCRASGLSAEVDADSLPRSRDLLRAADRLGADPLDLILRGGEDYELLMAVKPKALDGFLERASRGTTAISVIGRLFPGRPGIVLVAGRRRRPLTPRGFDHFRPG